VRAAELNAANTRQSIAGNVRKPAGIVLKNAERWQHKVQEITRELLLEKSLL